MGAEEILAALVPILIKVGTLVEEAVAAAKEKNAEAIATALNMADAGIDAAIKAMRSAVAANRKVIDAELAPPVPSSAEPKP
jgi:signal transduction histidine kinase